MFYLVLVIFTTGLIERNPSEYRGESINLEGDLMWQTPKPLKQDLEMVEEAKEPISKYHAGMNVLVYGHPNLFEVREKFKHLKELGINSIAITFPLFQDGWQANHIYENEKETPTIEEIEAMIIIAKQLNLRVMLRPIIDEESIVRTGHWRGSIEPSDVSKWFDSYQNILLNYAKSGQRLGLDVLNIGTEFNSMENQYSKKWLKTIQEIRKVYDGELTYSFNWNAMHHIRTNKFVKKLDYVGIDAYFPLDAPDGASISELSNAWQEWKQRHQDIIEDYNILITEVGVVPVLGAHRTPYQWEFENAIEDYQGQANYYQATFNAWHKKAEGIYWWCITLDDNREELDYSPLDTITEKILRENFLNHLQYH